MRRAPYSYDWLDDFGRRSPRQADPSLTDLAVGQSFMTIFELTDFTDSESLTLRTKAGRPTRIFGAITLHYRVETITGFRSRLVAALWMPPLESPSPKFRRVLSIEYGVARFSQPSPASPPVPIPISRLP